MQTSAFELWLHWNISTYICMYVCMRVGACVHVCVHVQMYLILKVESRSLGGSAGILLFLGIRLGRFSTS